MPLFPYNQLRSWERLPVIETSSRIPAGGFYQSVSRLYSATLLGFFNHTQSDSVFDAATGVEELAFCVDFGLDAEGLWYLIQSNHGCVADLLGDGEADILGHRTV